MDEGDVVFKWHDCNCSFYCPICAAELYADSENEERECDCGLRYSMSYSLKLTPPPAPDATP